MGIVIEPTQPSQSGLLGIAIINPKRRVFKNIFLTFLKLKKKECNMPKYMHQIMAHLIKQNILKLFFLLQWKTKTPSFHVSSRVNEVRDLYRSTRKFGVLKITRPKWTGHIINCKAGEQRISTYC